MLMSSYVAIEVEWYGISIITWAKDKSIDKICEMFLHCETVDLVTERYTTPIFEAKYRISLREVIPFSCVAYPDRDMHPNVEMKPQKIGKTFLSILVHWKRDW
ncbi:hypothetical protein PHYBLDRAFT_168249 [Phycomyces blakesleeanus NRRL 1555(-)]|uniref:Uncharacterized protein n=1 Tax=Phycomyces blakesleeanus (strain ATCC 8743b / DSM 1359 / FGSC 10004 / NBRC 33097 / NRRL 1555) TaxID=763407 RepID=A0A162NFR9_PHYB8|nr:hypothetical protein PHYBLDRAFT_168249 [Phycomyces blakesleeanus NRRL 1555(-)]OAD73818.1 hypothetical protein PHYBLDRAFT_168249 [Phycomyces blakesleeanus NRRL 1555(-)]|eukprot:XP_018291858.1 hypothetical protein PHYBLDRAFT_168249 [Phycomyces blakesleeanus NRRL 1555(-)]